MTEQQIYTPTVAYHVAVDRLETIARTFDPAAPDVLRSQIIEALGDLGVWPMSCLPPLSISPRLEGTVSCAEKVFRFRSF